jgi:hypothetical protein
MATGSGGRSRNGLPAPGANGTDAATRALPPRGSRTPVCPDLGLSPPRHGAPPSASIESMTDPSRTPAGWYDDGSGTGTLRYWDGSAWTEHTAPAASPAAQPPSEAVAAASVAAPESTPAADAPTEVVPPVDPIPPIPLYGPGSTQPTQPSGAAPTQAYGSGETQPYYAAAPGTAVMTDAGESSPNRKPHVLGIIALAVATVGFIFACIPGALIVGWVLLPIAFVLSIVALFLKGAKWPAITGLIVSIVGTIVGVVVFITVVSTSFTDAFEEVDGAIAEASEAAEAAEEPDAAEEPAPEPVSNLAFGETMVWEDGMELSASVPEPYSPTEFAFGADLPNNLLFTMTITNNTSENLEPLVYTRLSSGGQEASQIFDSGSPAGDVGATPTTVLLPGQSVTWKEAWSVADPNSLTMQIAPSWDYEDAIFTNAQ